MSAWLLIGVCIEALVVASAASAITKRVTWSGGRFQHRDHFSEQWGLTASELVDLASHGPVDSPNGGQSSLPELFVSCPSCKGLGNHLFNLRKFHRRTVLGLNGDPIDVSRFGDPPDGTEIINRWCAFCGHSWTRART